MKRYLLKRQVFVLFFSLVTINLFSQTFVEQTAISLPGISNGSVAWGDYDSDGDLDIFLTGYSSSGRISKIYRNNGNNTFIEQTDIALTGVDNSSVAWGDYDNDGDLDILLTGFSSSGRISKIYRNNGDNTFTEQIGIALIGVSSGSVTWGDYDNDGDLDILLTGWSNSGWTSKIYSNNSDNSFTEQIGIALIGVSSGSVTWGDYDSDGDLDIFLTGFSSSGYISKIYRNNGNNSFTEQTGILLTGVYNSSVVWGDYDNDGDLDILLTGYNSSSFPVSKIYRNNGNNSFTEQIGILLTGVYNSSVVWGDYDNDGNLDILLTGENNSSQPISKIYRNNGNNSFTEQTNITLMGVQYSSAIWGDYDNDSYLDILLIGQDAGGNRISKIYRNETTTPNIKPAIPSNLQAVINNGTVTFTWDKPLDTETQQNGLSYNLYVYENGQSNYECPPQAFKQVDAKNGKRLIAKLGAIQWRLAGYSIKDLPPSKTYYWTVQAVDAGLQGGNFSSEQSFAMPSYRPITQANCISFNNMLETQATVTWANGGGIKRAVFIKVGTTGIADPADNTTYNVNDITPGGWKCVYNGTGNSVVLIGLVPCTNYMLHVCEYNGAAGNENYLKSVAYQNPVILNTIFIEQTTIPLANIYISSVTWGDYDNDGDLDILFAGNSSSGFVSKIYRNNGDNSFTEQTGIALTGVANSSVAWSDYDNDGDLDILLTGANNSYQPISKIYCNNVDNSFTEQAGIALPGIRYSSVAWGDYDNNGDLDILLTGSSSSGVISKIYRNNGDNSFTEQTDIPLTGVYLGCVAWGDYDNDGFLDILLTGHTGTQLISKIFHNNGNNSFTEQTGIALTGVSNSSIAWGDYDNDGDLDILLTGATGDNPNQNPISKIYRNNGNNSFTEQTGILLTGVFYSSIAWGDYDNDGDLDILLTGTTNGSNTGAISKIYRNNGNNTFTEQTDIALTGVMYSSVKWGDYENDGDLDILLTGLSSSGYISKIYQNEILNPNIKPSDPTGLQSYWENDRIIFKWNKSFDNNTPTLAISYNLRIGTYPGGNEVKSGQALPNGKLLLTNIPNPINDTCFVIKLPLNKYYWSVQAVDKGGLASSFAPEEITPLDSIQAKDLQAFIKTNNSLLIRWKNGNGLRRAIFGRLSSTSGIAKPINGTIYHAEPYFGKGDKIGTTDWYCLYNGKTDSVIIYGISMGYSYDIQVVEYIESNGLPQYFNTIGNGNPGVFSTSLFSEQTSIALKGVAFSSSVWGDYDNDGFLDILFTGHTGTQLISKIFHNNGNNSFNEQTSITLTGVYYSSVAWGDYDNDGDLDILLTGASGFSPNYNPISKIYSNNSDNSFTEQTGILLTGVFYSSVAWGDYDSDGDLDILLTGTTNGSNTGAISKIYRNNSDKSFTEQTDIELTGVYNSSVTWVDYDNDGDLDILLTGRNSSNQPVSKIYSNTGNNTFTEQTGIILTGVYNGSIAWGDYDNDNDLDVLLTGGYISNIYCNNGDNNFTKLTAFALTEVAQSSVAWGDYDNDGDLDILLTGNNIHGQYISKIYRNNDDKTFTEQTDIVLMGVALSSIAWGDYDNDGDLDILLTGYNNSNPPIPISKIYRNNTFMKAGNYIANKMPSAPEKLLATSQPNGTKLSWSPVKTDETSYKTMTYNVKVGTSLLKSNILSAQSDSVNGYRYIIAMGNAQLDTTFFIKIHSSGKYYWSVQAVDQGFKGGAWSAADSFFIKNTQSFFKTDTVCQGLPTHFTDQSVVFDGIAFWKWDFKDGTTSSIQNPVHVFPSSGTYNVKLVITSNAGDKDSLEQKVIVKVRPSTFFSAPIVCEGAITTITNNTNTNGLTISDWFWNFGDGQTSILQQPGTHAYFLVGTYQTKLKAIATNGCADSITKEVVIAAIPNAAISVNGKTTFCQGDSVLLNVEYNPLYTYQWKLDNNDLINTDSSLYNVKLTSGAYLVKVTNTLANCISTSSPTSVTINPVPVSPYISTSRPNTFCQGDSTILNVTPTTGYSYQWKLNGGAVGTNQNSLVAKSSGTYAITVTNSSGCSANSTNTVNVVVNPKPTVPTVNVSGATSFCQGGSIEMNVANNPDYSYQWQNSGANISGATTNSYTVLNTGVYSLNITNSDGCLSKTENVTANVSPSPVAPSISSDRPVTFCEDDSINLSIASTTGYSYLWKLNGGAVGTNQNLFVAKSSGAYSITVTNSFSCSANSTNTINVVVNPKPTVPTVNVSGATSFCQGGNVELSVINIPGYAYQWENNGTGISGALTSTFVAQNSGVYSLKISNSNNCVTKTENVTVNALTVPAAPLISASGLSQFCQGDSIILSVTSTDGYTYQWKLNSGTVGTNSDKFTARNAGSYNVVVSNSSGCSASSSNSINVVVNSLPVTSAVNLSGPTQFCDGGSITLSIPSTSGYSYNWRNENGLIAGASTNSYTVTVSGNYQLDITNASGCVIKTSPVNVVVKPMPFKPVIASDNYQPGKCLGETPIKLKVNQVGSGYNYQWYKYGIPISNATASFLEGFLSQGDYSLEANLDGCKSQSDIYNVFFADAPEKPYIYAQGPTVWYLACSNDSASQYRWYYNGNLISGADKYIYVANRKLGQYYVSISNAKGCFTMSDVVTIPTGVTGIDDVDPFGGLKIYPNPTPGLFTIEMDNQLFGDLIIVIFSQEGKEMLKIKFEKTTVHFSSQIDLSGQAKGMYLINLLIDKYFATRKVVVE